MTKISARNVFAGKVEKVEKGATTAHVVVQVQGARLTAAITNESVDDLELKAGREVKAIVKASDVILAVD
ncbi:molybdopterin-binding protein [Methylosinus sp. Sm6]|uniref:TOBE domain-containing protein n=1 Tax=Methylosinus sp. Sm6 TaxID=2866948 RepID=UPI001C9A0DF3|nr:TOBE domain-containing protein [Methylosinus sp. Sm6]MBY6242400.1 TOBE domain-containing protein [Methylosinus sp. Sm6]